MAVTTYSSAGTGLWLCPAGVMSVAVACWGGGGGGQQTAPIGLAGFGGGGGEYASEPSVAVTPGRLYRWTAGNGGFSRGASFGGTSGFTGDSLSVAAHGGQGGNGSAAGGTGSANTVHFSGGNGGSSNSAAAGGGGGSAGSGGAGGNGGNASGGTGGSGGTAGSGGGALGGHGSPLGAGGQAGFSPGAGGGGGANGALGGAGAPGQVQLTYTLAAQPVVPYFPAGYKPLNSDFDQWIQAPDAFLTSKVVFRAELSSAQALINGDTLIPFNSIIEDPFSGWEAGSSQWLCPAGYTATYDVALTISCQPQGPQPVVQARVGVNSAAQEFTVDKAWVPASAVPGIASGSCQVQLYGGTDSVQGYAHLSATGNVVTTSGQRCQMTISWADL